MIPSKIRRDGVKGRFDPSEPLHMTTRHAAARVRVNSDPSINGSYEDEDDRQPPFDEVRSATSRSLGSPTSLKGRRMSGTSNNSPPNRHPSSETKRRRSSARPVSPVQQQRHLSPGRKRKRSTPTPQPETPNGSGTIATPAANLNYSFDKQIIGFVPRDALSDRELGGSSPSGSDEQMASGYLGITESTEFTPAVSEAVSPVSENSDVEVSFPAKDVVKAAFPSIEINDADEADDIDELGEADEAEDAEDVDDVDVEDGDGDDQSRVYGEGFPRRRWAGRRRAEHPVPEIEAVMRRQLALKSMYRSISRALKPVLAEIAFKTVEELEANPSKHQEVVEYQGTNDKAGIQEQLDQALERRKQQINAQLKWNQQLLKEAQAAEIEVRESRRRLQIEEKRDQLFDRLEHDMLVIARKAQLSNDNTSYETSDEDGDVLPMPKGMGYRFTRKNALDPKYDSRSRMALEMERATSDLHARYKMTKMLREFEDSEEIDLARGFTVMDPRARNAAIARSTGIRTTDTLANAAAEIELVANKPKIPVIPNAEALGLQMLGDLAIRPSIRAPEPGSGNKTIGVEKHIEKKPEIQMPPPLPPPPHGRRSAVFDIINLLQQDTFGQLSNQRQAFDSPGLALSSPRRSSNPAPASREHGLKSPMSNTSSGLAFAPPPAMSPTYGGAHQSQHMFSHPQHSRTVSLGSPSQIKHPQFHPAGPDGSHWHQTQLSASRDGEPGQAGYNQRSLQLFSQDGPLRIERVAPAESHEHRQPPPPPEDRFNDNSPSSHLLARPLAQAQSQSQWEAPGSTVSGATDFRGQQMASPHGRGHSGDANASTPALQQRSRASSTKSHSTSRDFTPDTGNAGDSAYHKRQQAESTIKFSSKLSKEQRSGRSRKDHRSAPKSNQGSPAVDNKPPIIKYHLNPSAPVLAESGGSMNRFRLNRAVGAEAWPTSPTPGPPQAGQQGGYYPQQDLFSQPTQHPPRHIAPPIPGYPSRFFSDTHHSQRSSLPGAGQQHWQHPPPGTSVFGMPQGAHPPGYQPPAEQWQHQPPPPHFGPPNPARGPHGTMQTTATPVTQQYGGPTIAPASGPQDRHAIYSNTGSSNHLPAFAQRGSQEANNSRKRAQSDAPKHEFRQYVPKDKSTR